MRADLRLRLRSIKNEVHSVSFHEVNMAFSTTCPVAGARLVSSKKVAAPRRAAVQVTDLGNPFSVAAA